MRTGIRKWHGSIGDRMVNIHSLVSVLVEKQTEWDVPPDLLARLTADFGELRTLVEKCHSVSASSVDRGQRNALMQSTVDLCRTQVRIWIYGQYAAGTVSANDVHSLGFRLPGETGGRRERTKATDAMAEVKVRIVNEDFIRAVVDHAAGENAALVARGWPVGVRNALIVITSVNTGKEIYRRMTTRIHNDIHMPDGSHGKPFFIRAAFLKHVGDSPVFGGETLFVMPLSPEETIAEARHPNHDEVERLRLEVGRLRAELDAAKNGG
jgi:hypothetical protein